MSEETGVPVGGKQTLESHAPACPLLSFLPSPTTICGGAAAETYKQLGWGFGTPGRGDSFPQMPSLLPAGPQRLVDGGSPFPRP